MRFKDFRIDPKSVSDEGDGSITAYVATFDREPDSYGDVIARGAFSRSLKEWDASGKPIPLLFAHNMDDPDYNIGRLTSVAEDERGLLATAEFDGSGKAQRVRQLVREGRVSKMSFAYDVRDAGPVTLDGGVKANELRDLDIFEASIVTVPANQHAEIIDAKAAAKAGRAISAATRERIEGAIDAISDAAEALRELIAEPANQQDSTTTGEDADEGGAGEEPETANPDAKSSDLIARIEQLDERKFVLEQCRSNW